jgi:ATP synthase I subunit
VDSASAPDAVAGPADVTTQAVERRLAVDLARHGSYIAPVVVVGAGIARGVDGAASAALGLGLVVVNFLATAWLMGWAAKRSATTLAVMALGGFLARMAVLLGAMFLADALFGWVDVLVVAVTLFGAHLGLLFWELRSVSLTLAAPGLRRDRLTSDPKGVAE